jgi:VanZ family protein
MMPRRFVLLSRALLVACLATITFLALTSQPIRMVTNVNDKLQHAAAFYGLALLLDFSFPERGMGIGKIAPLLVYGGLLEVWQMLAPPRDPSLWDIVADLAGIALYAWSVPLYRYVPIARTRWGKR